MPARPRGLLEPCAATSGPHGSAELPEHGTPYRQRAALRDITFNEDAFRVRTGSRTMASLRNFAIALIRRAGYTNTTEGLRWASYNFTHPLTLLGLT